MPAATLTKHKEKVKPPVPTKEEKPLMGLKSNKNFITTNAGNMSPGARCSSGRKAGSLSSAAGFYAQQVCACLATDLPAEEQLQKQ